jgi:hypothetical protein
VWLLGFVSALNLGDPNREIVAVGEIGTHNNMMFNWVAQYCVALQAPDRLRRTTRATDGSLRDDQVKIVQGEGVRGANR